MASSNKEYRHYPPDYAGFILQFKRAGAASIGPLPERQARTLLRDLNRYRAALRIAVAEDPGDETLVLLADAARDCLLRVDATGDDDRSREWFVRAEINPLLAALAAGRVHYGR